jgi:TPR repeat protein
VNNNETHALITPLKLALAALIVSLTVSLSGQSFAGGNHGNTATETNDFASEAFASYDFDQLKESIRRICSGYKEKDKEIPSSIYIANPPAEYLSPPRMDIYDRYRHALKKGRNEDAMVLLNTAITMGNPLAMHDMALSSSHGTKDADKAVYLYRQAAEWMGTGYAGSQNNLGHTYEIGNGNPQSPGDAIHWYTRAAMQGEPTAYLSLGLSFANGMGVQKNLTDAYLWLTLAIRDLHSGFNRQKAVEKLQEISKEMTSEQINVADTRAKDFRPYIQSRWTLGDPPSSE